MSTYVFAEIWGNLHHCCTTTTWAAFTTIWTSLTSHASTSRKPSKRMSWPWRVFPKQSQVGQLWLHF